MKAIVVLFALIAISAGYVQPVLGLLEVRLPDIVKQSQDVHPDGSYSYEYETAEGIKASESGVGGVSAQGEVKYTDPDGTPVELTYVADENGYRASGSHVHPIPDYILRAIEYNEKYAPKQAVL